MKKSILFLLLAILALNVFAQADKGIHFEHGTTWKAILAKAKAEKKYIMIDCYSTWCGPCKKMSGTVFTQEQVGTFYNDKFINVKVQLDTTKNDNDEVKRWYADAKQIAKNGGVNVYPTILYFSPDGKLVHRAVGFMDSEAFVKAGEDAVNPERQYITLIERYKSNPGDKAALHALAIRSAELYDLPLASEIGAKYLAGGKSLTSAQADYIVKFTRASTDPGFKIALKHAKEIDAIVGDGATDNMMSSVIFSEEIYPYFSENRENPNSINWNKKQKSLQLKYPGVNLNGIMPKAEMLTISDIKDPAKKNAMINRMEKQYKPVTPAPKWAEILNACAWNIATTSDNALLLTTGLRQSKEAVNTKGLNDNVIAQFTDTYAVLLYKSGRKDEAITTETHALELAQKAGEDYSSYSNVLDKMKKNVKDILND